MKISNQLSKHFILVGLIILTSTPESFSQVITRVLSPEDKIENYIPWYNPDEETPVSKTPVVDLEAVLQEDVRTDRQLPRIGIKQEVQYNTTDGKLIHAGNYTIWKWNLANDNAKSLRFKLCIKDIPSDFVLFYFNDEYNFLAGPIKSKNFRNNSYVSDYIPGNQVSIILFLPHGQIEVKEDDIRVDDIYIGLETTYAFDSAFGTSLPCNINVACDEGIGWDCQISSVCKIITGDGACTGSLVNNDCCDLTPYVLTADHCLRDVFENLNDLGGYSFRFNYQSPQCNPSQEPNPSQWIVFNGSQFRSSWGDTDFGLLELLEDGIKGLSYSGWNREVNPPTNEVTCIHHPSGDVKKIAVNSDGVGIQGNFWNIQQFDAGLVEPGSSGSPLFDENQLIIGDLSGGDLNSGCDGDHGLVDNNTYGQLSISWIGGGAANSRLRDWQGASTNPNTIDCMEHPFINGFDGMDVLCHDEVNGEFTLVNNMPCAKFEQWEVSPSYLFSSPTSGKGNSFTLQTNPGVRGNAIITYTLSSEGCNDAEVEKSFWIGPPEDLSFDGIYGDMFICVGASEQYFVLLEDLLEQGVTNYFWSVSPSSKLQILGSHINQNDVFVRALAPGFAQINFHATNRCGTTVSTLDVIISESNCDGGGGFEFRSSGITSESPDFKVNVFPNPANDFIEVACSGYTPGTRIAARLISTDGKAVRELEEYSQNFKVDMADLPSGLYVLQLNADGVIYHEKIVKL